ncbi:MAG: HrpB1 family type III secretion system apparatus protein [Puniceicoccales bacterium]|nr:HrpB1 family type III secretion system apparatus protein [Puniceicoccales bacterium]
MDTSRTVSADAADDKLEYPDIPTDIIRMLMDIGYVAAGCGLKSHAESIFDALIAARPSSELPLIGLAVVKITFGRISEASKILTETVTKINPDSQLAKAFFGLLLKQIGSNHESEIVLNEVIKNNSDEDAVTLAKSILSDSDNKKLIN